MRHEMDTEPVLPGQELTLLDEFDNEESSEVTEELQYDAHSAKHSLGTVALEKVVDTHRSGLRGLILLSRGNLSFSERYVNPHNHSRTEALTAKQTELLHRYLPHAEYLAIEVFRNDKGSTAADFDEFISDAYFGLAKAISRYDPKSRSEEATTDSDYFTKYIKGELLRGLRNRMGRIRSEKDEDTGKIVVIDKIAPLNPSVISGTARSLQEPTDDATPDSELTLGDTIASPDSEIKLELAIAALDTRSNLKKLTYMEREIFIRRVALDQKQADIASAIGVSPVTVSRRLGKIAKMELDKQAA
jgi:RNA polymerase sigma factor (sigma-70 family)